MERERERMLLCPSLPTQGQGWLDHPVKKESPSEVDTQKLTLGLQGYAHAACAVLKKIDKMN
jgi:hypothetical protein